MNNTNTNTTMLKLLSAIDQSKLGKEPMSYSTVIGHIKASLNMVRMKAITHHLGIQQWMQLMNNHFINVEAGPLRLAAIAAQHATNIASRTIMPNELANNATALDCTRYGIWLTRYQNEHKALEECIEYLQSTMSTDQLTSMETAGAITLEQIHAYLLGHFLPVPTQNILEMQRKLCLSFQMPLTEGLKQTKIDEINSSWTNYIDTCFPNADPAFTDNLKIIGIVDSLQKVAMENEAIKNMLARLPKTYNSSYLVEQLADTIRNYDCAGEASAAAARKANHAKGKPTPGLPEGAKFDPNRPFTHNCRKHGKNFTHNTDRCKNIIAENKKIAEEAVTAFKKANLAAQKKDTDSNSDTEF